MAEQSPLEVCLIDAGIVSIKQLKLPTKTIYLNLHCNKLKQIDGVSHLGHLKHLDLSSNEISRLSGLSSNNSLHTLNLACNRITKVEGLQYLRSLKNLNVSFNQITDLSGLKVVTNRTHQLHKLDIFGNKVRSLNHVVQCLSQCTSLKSVNFKKDNNVNPVCALPAYRPNVFAQMPFLEDLDGVDKHGNKISDEFDCSDIPGLDEYLELIAPSSTKSISHDSSAETDLSVDNIVTPKIDSVLFKFKQRKGEAEEVEGEKSDELKEQKQSLNVQENIEDDGTIVSERLNSLEEKLSTLVQLCTDQHEVNSNPQEKIAVSIASTSTSDDAISSTSEDPKELTMRTVKQSSIQQAAMLVKQGYQGKNRPKRYTSGVKPALNENQVKATRAVTSVKNDETYLSLMHEIDSERERRWKAERASRKLLDNIKILQERLVEERKIQEAAITSSTKLKHALDVEITSRQNFEAESVKLEKENEELHNELDVVSAERKTFENELKTLQLATLKLEKEKAEEEIHHRKRFKDLQMDSGASKREIELLRNTIEKQRSQIQQLQELLISREQDNKDKLQSMVRIDSKEVKDLIETELTKCESRNAQVLKQHIERLKERNTEYTALEDEFRMALQIEANRYNELHVAFEQSSNELNELQTTFEEITLKEAKSRNLVTELSSLAKEQKARITEIMKSKQDMQLQYKERLSQVQNELTSFRSKAFKVESLQQDKERMAAHIRGQESVIHGLRSERKLWGQELAQQGASLAQARGHLDVQLDSQQKEIALLRNQLKDGSDSLKIKCKLIEDQTVTIRNMKQQFLKLTDENKKMTEEEKKERNYLEDDLEQTKHRNMELQESVDALTDRKEELKLNLSEAEDELETCKADLKKLRHQWDERSKIIDQFEMKVIQMKNSFEEKERNLINQRDESTKVVSNLKEKLKTLEDKHCLELATTQHNFELELRKVISAKDDEIQKAKEEVLSVEEEMRVVLIDTAAQKNNFEMRVKQLSKAFNDIQSDLS